jgi:putative flippase GtrA
MNLVDLTTLGYWNTLARAHLPELVMVLTAAAVALTDRYLRRLLHRATASWNKALRFLAFLGVCSVGYAALALGLAFLLRAGLTWREGAYMAPAVGIALLLISFEAQRQRQS